jgi:uridylate kinase
MHTRILLKLSGEQLAGTQASGIDGTFCTWLASELKPVRKAGIEIVIMVGGGNYARGAQLAGHGISRVTADNVGMLATIMNAVALTDIFNAAGLHTHAVSTVQVEQIADQFTHRRALNHLQKGRVVVVGGGIGRPYLTTDTAAVSLALELECSLMLKATKVDGVYTSDPVIHPDATKLTTVSYDEALSNEAIKVMDKAALGLAMEHRLPVIVFDALSPGAIGRAVNGDTVGTRIG